MYLNSKSKILEQYFNNKKTILQFIEIIFLRILGVVTVMGLTIFLTRNFDTKIIGQFEFIKTFLVAFASICMLGCDQSIIYFSGILKGKNNSNEIKNIYKKMLIIIFFVWLIILVFILLLGREFISQFFKNTDIYNQIVKATIFLLFYSVSSFNSEMLRAIELIKTAELFRNVFKWTPVIIGSIFILVNKKQEYLIDVFLYGFVVLTFFSTLIIIINQKGKRIDPDKKTYSYKEIFSSSYPMSLSMLSIFLLMSFDVFFLKKYRGDTEVAYYATAFKIMSILLLIMNSTTISISKDISEAFVLNDYERLKKIMKNSTRLIFGLSIPFAVIVSIFSGEILSFFGGKFIEAKATLVIFMIGQSLSSMFGAVQVYLNMTGRQKTFQIVLILAVIISLILNRFLIPKYGMIGGAISYSISVLFWNIVATIIIYKKDKINIFIN
jgi:O-antigen/teichoic acid export membrane protein